MAGHSKFKNIMHRKGAQDKKRSALFSKLSKEITVAAKMGGSPDPDANARLRTAIANAKAQSMPKDNIKRAIDKSLSGEGDNYEEIRYEGYGPGGVAVIVETLTDNRNRTASEVRAAFSKAGGNMGETGSVAFMFDRVGSIEFEASVADADAMMEAAIEAGADDCETTEDGHEVTTSMEEMHEVASALESQFGEPRSVRLIFKPQNTNPLDDDKAESLFKMLDVLDDNDDVQATYDNSDLSEDQMEKLAG